MTRDICFFSPDNRFGQLFYSFPELVFGLTADGGYDRYQHVRLVPKPPPLNLLTHLLQQCPTFLNTENAITICFPSAHWIGPDYEMVLELVLL